MKKIVLLFLVLGFMSCSLDSESETYVNYTLVPITGNDLPEFFEIGKTYEVNVDYQLPTECYAFSGLDARRAGNTPELKTKIYVGAISIASNDAGCDNTTEGDSGTSKFSIFIDEEESYEFNFWVGKDSTGQPMYETVTVPVQEATAQ